MSLARKKKKRLSWLLVLVVLAACLGTASFFAADRVVKWGTQLLIRNLSGTTLAEGVRIASVSCKKARAKGLRTAEWRQFSVALEVNPEETNWDHGQWTVSVDRAVLRWRGLLSGTVVGKFHDVSVHQPHTHTLRSRTRGGRAVSITGLTVLCDRAVIRRPIPRLSANEIQAAFRDGAKDVRRWFAGEPAAGDIELSGTVQFRIDDEPVRVDIHTEEGPEGVTLRANEADVREAVKAFGDRLTEAEVELAAHHPLRLPGLLSAKATAERVSEQAYRSNPGKEDAYRHVTWSWLLCDYFGPEFALQVTEAHESGSTNTDAESARDRKNNRLGRDFWEQSVPFDALKDKVETDPRIAIRNR